MLIKANSRRSEEIGPRNFFIGILVQKQHLRHGKMKPLPDNYEPAREPKHYDGALKAKNRTLANNDAAVHSIWDLINKAEEAEGLLLGSPEKDRTEAESRALAAGTGLISQITGEALSRHGKERSLYFSEKQSMHFNAVEAAEEAASKILDRAERELKVDPRVTQKRLEPREIAENERRNIKVDRFEADLTRLEGLLKDANET